MLLSNLHIMFQTRQQRLGIRVIISNIRVIKYLIKHDVYWKSGYESKHEKEGWIACGFMNSSIVGKC